MNTNSNFEARKDFAGKNFWLCGASSGIGFGVAEVLAKHRANLVLMARSETSLANAAQKLRQMGSPDVKTIALDIGEESTPARAKSFLGNQKLDGVLLNSGGPHGGDAFHLTWKDFESAHRLLLMGPAALLCALFENLQTPGASVIAITSTTVKEPNPDLPLSAAYRTGLTALLKNFSDALGPRGVRINCVAPGYTNTEKLQELAKYVAKKNFGSESDSNVSKVYAEWGNKSPLKRIASVEEIAQVCEFLFSSRSSYINGQTLVADGGMGRGY